MADRNRFIAGGTIARGMPSPQATITPGDLIEVIPTAGADLGKVRRHRHGGGTRDTALCGWQLAIWQGQNR